jgi:hypothetical protein
MQGNQYHSMNDEGALGEEHILDEESIHWHVLLLRIVAIIILLVIIALVVLGASLSRRAFVLAAIMFVCMVLVLFCSFFKFDRMSSRYIYRYGDVSAPSVHNVHTIHRANNNSTSSLDSKTHSDYGQGRGTNSTTRSELHRSVQDSLFSGAAV